MVGAVSLLDRGPHTVTVQTMVRSRDGLGSTLAEGEQFTLAGVSVQPVEVSGAGVQSMEDGARSGTQVRTTYRVIARGPWPGGPHSRVRVDVGPMAGRWFDQSGEAREYVMSPRTSHVVVMMTVRNGEVG